MTRTNLRPSPLGARRIHRRLRLWLRVRFAQPRLDRELAAGAPPGLDLAFAWRAAELCDPRFRRSLAADVEHLLDAATEPPSPLTASAPLNRAALQDCSGLLRTLADRLRDPADSQAQGVALAHLLLTDPAGPLYHPDRGREVGSALATALTALGDVDATS